MVINIIITTTMLVIISGIGPASHAGGIKVISKSGMLFLLSGYSHQNEVADNGCGNDD